MPNSSARRVRALRHCPARQCIVSRRVSFGSFALELAQLSGPSAWSSMFEYPWTGRVSSSVPSVADSAPRVLHSAGNHTCSVRCDGNKSRVRYRDQCLARARFNVSKVSRTAKKGSWSVIIWFICGSFRLSALSCGLGRDVFAVAGDGAGVRLDCSRYSR